MNTLYLDFETYYSAHQRFSLDTMPQTLYLRDPRFEVLMVGLAEGAGPVVVHTGEDAVRETLAAVAWDESLCVSHNAMFDMAILTGHLGHRPRWIWDTLAHARLIYPRVTAHNLGDLARFLGVGEKGQEIHLTDGIDGARLAAKPLMLRQRFEAYCAHDVELVRRCHLALPPLAKHDASSIDEGVRMTSEPILELDGDTLDRLATEGSARAGQHARLRSKDTFAAELRKLGVEPETKRGKKGEQYAFAKTDPAMRRLLGHAKPEVRRLAEARITAQSNDELKRTETLAAIAKTGPLPAGIVPCKAHTGRDSGGERDEQVGVGTDKINLQNLRRDSEIRKTIQAPEGWSLVVADLAQIEARVLAAMSGEDWLCDAFRQGRDVYAELASQVFGYPVTKETHPRERQVGKVAMLACGFEMGAARFAEEARKDGLEMDDATALRIVSGYRRQNAAVVAFWSFCGALLRDMAARGTQEKPILREAPGIALGVGHERIILPSGRTIRYPNLVNRERKRPERWDWHISPVAGKPGRVYGGLVAENVTQAVARDILMLQAYRIRNRTEGMRSRLAIRVHDELVFACPDDEVERMVEVAREEMVRGEPDWTDVPLAVEVAVARTWGHAK